MANKLNTTQLVEFKRLQSLADNTAFRLGVQRAEYLNYEKKILEEIVRCETAQREFGEKILKELGLDFVKDTYTFTSDGEIKILVSGKYEDVS